MVFATDFDPVDASARRQTQHRQTQSGQPQRGQTPAHLSAQPRSIHISPITQTSRLIAEATRSHKMTHPTAARKTAARKSVARKVVATKVQPDADGIAIAARGLSGFQRDPNALAPLPLTAKPPLPLGLKILNRIQHGSTALTGLLIASALVLYGSSVYVDKSANRAMAHLNHLEDESQQLISANEAIKQTLAEEATQENSGLKPYEAGDVLFVEPAPLREPVIREPAAPDAVAIESETEKSSPQRLKPLGY